VAGIFLQQVEQHAFQGGRVGAIPALARLPDLVQVVGLDDRAGAYRLLGQLRRQGAQGLVGSHVPAIIAEIGPGVRDVLALKPPLQPATLDVPQVLEQFKRSPAGWQPAAAQVRGREAGQLDGQLGTEVVEVPEEYLGTCGRRAGWLGKRNAHIPEG
jgi:hypothetical protein